MPIDKPLGRAVEYLLQHPNKTDWWNLLQHPDKINWYWFSVNSNQQAVEYLIQNPEKIVWHVFGTNNNPEAFEYYMQYAEHICLNDIADNPQLFALDYSAMSLIRTRHNEADLFAASYTPKRVSLHLTSRLDSKIKSTFDDFLAYD